MTAVLLLGLLVASPPQPRITTPGDTKIQQPVQPFGVRVPLPNGTLLIQPLTEKVVRVRFSPNGKFLAQRVPTIIYGDHHPTYRVHASANGSDTVIELGALSVWVTKSTGRVIFKDAAGKTVFAESTGSRLITPETLPGPKPTPSYQIQQGFELKPDEAVYGLGQHQSGLLDYRGSLVSLEQVNREIAIPFLLTSSGYGLLWNNPAHTDVNVALNEKPLLPRQEKDEQGIPGQFTVRYFKGQHFEDFVGASSEATIDHVWSATRPAGLPHDNYSARWTGYIDAPESTTYEFKTLADDGVRLFIDDAAIIDNWEVHPATQNTARLKFQAHSRHKFRLEYFQAGGGAEIHMTCSILQPTNQLKFRSEAGDGVDYCFFYGPSPEDVVREYRHTTGDAPLPPKTALGYWQSKERYASQKEWIDIAAEYRKRHHPIDNLVQDWFYWDPAPWGSHQFDPKRYPDPAAGIASLHNDYHLQFMISVWGKFIPGSPEHPNANLKAMDERGFLYPGIDSDERYYDAFNPAARRLYYNLMDQQLFTKGVDAWWLDASEPEVNMHDFRSVPTAVGPAATVLNGWPLMHTIGVSSGQLKSNPDKRVFILTRSAYAGQQRTGAASWSGDISATWQVYADQIPAGLNFCLSGIPYWTTDIGAFFVPGYLYPKHAADPKYRELFTRWFQYGSFCPIFRVHGTDFAKEMWRFGPETEKILNTYDELRYRLMPYIYSQAWNVTSRGSTLMRALVLDYPNDLTARELKDEFLFGPSLLVCPVIRPGARMRSVYLPKGNGWTDFWTGKTYAGGTTVKANAPISKIPLFVRSGAIIPMGPVMQYVDEKPTDPIELRIYPGATGSFSLYEDEGNNNRYRSGAHTLIPFLWNDKAHTLTIGTRQGTYPGAMTKRTIRLVVGTSSFGGPAEGPSARVVSYNGTRTVVKL